MPAGTPLRPTDFGRYFASPNGEPTDDPHCRSFPTLDEAIAYATELLPTVDNPPRELADGRVVPGALLPFVAVGQYRDDEESHEAAAEDAAEFGEGWPLYVPYGWVDRDGYHDGSWEDSSALWG